MSFLNGDSSVLIGTGLSIMGVLLAAYAKGMVVEGIKDYLNTTLPGLLSIELAKWTDKADAKYASSERVKTLESRVNSYEASMLKHS